MRTAERLRQMQSERMADARMGARAVVAGEIDPPFGMSVEDGEAMFLDEYDDAAVEENKARLKLSEALDYLLESPSHYSDSDSD